MAIFYCFIDFYDQFTDKHKYETYLANLMSNATPEEQDKILFIINYKYIDFISRYNALAYQDEKYGRAPEFVSLMLRMSKNDIMNCYIQINEEIELEERERQRRNSEENERKVHNQKFILEIASKRQEEENNAKKIKTLQEEVELLNEVLLPDKVLIELRQIKRSKNKISEIEEYNVLVEIENRHNTPIENLGIYLFCTDEKTDTVRREEYFNIRSADKILQNEKKHIEYSGLSTMSFFKNIPTCKITFISLIKDESKTRIRNMLAGYTDSHRKIFKKYKGHD